MLLSAFIQSSSASLEAVYPAQEARNIVLILCESLLGVKSYTHIIEPQTEISQSGYAALQSALDRLLLGEPLQYVLGFAPFYGRDFKVCPSVLIPRPETELLVERVIGQARAMLSVGRSGLRVLDLCTGSGCIAWTLALELPGAEVVAIDISEEALAVADSQPLEAVIRPQFLRGDILAPVALQSAAVRDALSAGFDIIVSNPPYVMDSEKAQMRPNVLEHEPHLALFVRDEDPLVFYRAVGRWCSELLLPQGYAIVEINEHLGEETAALFRAFPFADICIHSDLAAKPRDISFRK